MLVLLTPEHYRLANVYSLITPALLVYPALVESNIAATIKMAGGDPNRWRPHIKTAKIPAVLKMLLDRGVQNLKCSTTLELLTACRIGFPDVLLAFPLMGANAKRTVNLAAEFPKTRISVLVESARQIQEWNGTNIGLFIDINSGMNRTGVAQEGSSRVAELAQLAGKQFRGLHYYDGQLSSVLAEEREAQAHAGYRKVMALAEDLLGAGIAVEEVITSGTPAAPYAMTFSGFGNAPFIHRISPGTVVYNDLNSLKQLPSFGYHPAVCVLATVVSHPTENTITCDAGHKSVSVDSGVPNCSVLGYEHLQPSKPSEEHLPIESPTGEGLPALGESLYLFPKHVCPTVNNFDHALFIRDGRVESVEAVSARGHEQPLLAARR